MYVVWITAGAIVLIALLIFAINRTLTVSRYPVATGREEIKGMTVPVRTSLNPKGTVLLEGEIWEAILDEGKAKPGEEVIITGLKGLRLCVTKKNKGGCLWT